MTDSSVFDDVGVVPYTPLVRRLVAILLGLAVVSSAGLMPATHIHRYADHDHPEHHHGPAIHEHRRAQALPNDGLPQWTTCDPGQHAVSLTVGCAAVPLTQIVEAESSSATVLPSLVRLQPARELTDVRVHGPPPRTQAPPRAPPLTLPA